MVKSTTRFGRNRRARRILLTPVVWALATVFITELCLVHAQTTGPEALTGQVTSKEEGPMEGVLVSAKKTGS